MNNKLDENIYCLIVKEFKNFKIKSLFIFL
jgi:hypothetical protein